MCNNLLHGNCKWRRKINVDYFYFFLSISRQFLWLFPAINSPRKSTSHLDRRLICNPVLFVIWWDRAAVPRKATNHLNPRYYLCGRYEQFRIAFFIPACCYLVNDRCRHADRPDFVGRNYPSYRFRPIHHRVECDYRCVATIKRATMDDGIWKIQTNATVSFIEFRFYVKRFQVYIFLGVASSFLGTVDRLRFCDTFYCFYHSKKI